MAFAKNVWKLLVAIKDGLSLVFLLLFFVLLFAILTARPSPASVREGALLLDLGGFIVEEKSPIDPFTALTAPDSVTREHDVQELVRSIEAAAEDERINSVVLDMREFLGGGSVHLREIGAALDAVRAADKPVFAYAVAYTDDSLRLAAHASEVWVDSYGGAIIQGAGGNRLYYGEMLDKLGVNARIFKVGTYKSAVEPFERNSMSEPARENARALYGALWEDWLENVKEARPQADLARVTQSPADWIEATGGDFSEAAVAAGLVDRIGSWASFGERVAEVAGEDRGDRTPGAFAHTEFGAWLADNPLPDDGDAIGVITIAGEIVDGDAGPGTAGGERIVRLLDEALADDIAGLVVRVDSPGGSVLASESIREAILRHKERDIPIAVSMANVAASGGYWVSTPADRIFAEPETITGSIGVFGIVPSFEELADRAGVSADGVGTTPISGEPDFVEGFSPEIERILQASVGNTYAEFVGLVAQARGLSPERVDAIGQGRVWDGGTARQIRLIDQFGDLDDALAWVAERAEIGDGDYHARFLGSSESQYETLLRQILGGSDARASAPGDLFAVVARQQAAMPALIAADMQRMLGRQGAQAFCLACPGTGTAAGPRADGRAASGDTLSLVNLLRVLTQ